MKFLDCLNSSNFDFTKNLSGSKIIKFQQSQALTSYFESFWSIVHGKLPGVSRSNTLIASSLQRIPSVNNFFPGQGKIP